MEFNEKLQELRKQKGLTQEELAEVLYVSRTAVSKWESGRGYPNIESLKQISAYFSITLDDLLSTDELLTMAEADSTRKVNRTRDVVYGLLDISAGLLFFLPLFGQTYGAVLQEVSLLNLLSVADYVRIAYMAVVLLSVSIGVLTLALRGSRSTFWQRCKAPVSLVVSATGVVVFILGTQPYAATLLFAFLAIKALLVLKKK